ncbi:TPA: acetyltransferase, partial [Escherichia coli]
PSEEEYGHPRWYIPVTDAADLCYLLLWLAELK